MDKIFGLLELDIPILCKKEVVGEKFKTKIKGIDVNVILPSFDKSKDGLVGMNHNLISPDIFKGTKRGDSDLEWGSVVAYPSRLSSIKLIALEFKLESGDKDEVIQSLYNVVPKWGSTFIDYIYLTTRQSIFSGVDMESPNSSLELFANKPRKYIPKRAIDPIRVVITIEDDRRALSIENMTEILGMLSSEKELRLEYQLLLKSYYSRKDNNLRQTIIDGAASFEICLSKSILSTCNSMTIDGESLLEGKSLGALVNLLEELKIETSTKTTQKYRDKIVSLRNDVVHTRDLNPTKKAVNILLDEVNMFLEKYSPGYFEE